LRKQNYLLIVVRAKSSFLLIYADCKPTPQTPKRDEHARWRVQKEAQDRDEPRPTNCVQKCQEKQPFSEKKVIKFLNFRKKKRMTEARKEGKAAATVGSLRS